MKVLSKENIISIWENFSKLNIEPYKSLIGFDLSKLPMTTEDKNALNRLFNIIKPMDILDLDSSQTLTESTDNDYFAYFVSKGYNSKVSHRLYFNYDIPTRTEFIRRVIKACNDRKLPFNLKTYKGNGRLDNTVMYLSDEEVKPMAEVLESVCQEYPKVLENKTLPMSAVPLGWFGYGIEPNNSLYSYNSMLEKGILSGFAETVSDYHECIDLENSLTQFSKSLLNFALQKRKDDMEKLTGNYIDFDKQDLQYFSKTLDSMSLKIATTIINNGFAFRLDTNEKIVNPFGVDAPNLKLSNPDTDVSLNITPYAITHAVVKNGKLKFDSDKQKKAFYSDLCKNVEKQLSKIINLDITPPSALSNISIFEKEN